MASKSPDLIVGIDVGTTCTGVAYAIPINSVSHSPEVVLFTDWEDANDDPKVPTQVFYAGHNTDEGPSDWGFKSVIEAGPTFTYDRFKTRLSLPDLNRPLNWPSASTLYEDFLSQLYNHLKEKLIGQIDCEEWDSASITFLFSVPATWNSEDREIFKSIIANAGFGGGKAHSVSITLTEPEAAAVFAMNEGGVRFQNGDRVLVVDAGGGTTDLCFVGIEEQGQVNGNKQVQLSELDPVIGGDVGSAHIDEDFQQWAKEKLEKVGLYRIGNLPSTSLAWEMAKSKGFQGGKCQFNGETDSSSSLLVPVRGLGKGDTFAKSSIDEGQLIVNNNKLKGLFDKQINGIKELLDIILNEETVGRSEVQEEPKKLDHIILSGGLGSSKYLQKCITAYIQGAGNLNWQGVAIHQSSSPRLCVCQGLVQDHLRSVYDGESMFKRLFSPFSFGILIDKGFITMKPGSTSKSLVEWMIDTREGMAPGEKTYKDLYQLFELGVKKDDLKGKITIVSSLEDIRTKRSKRFKRSKRSDLHDGMNEYQTLCCDYSGLDVHMQHRLDLKWIGFGEKFQRVDFKIMATFGLDGVTFECLSMDEKTTLSVNPVKLESKAEWKDWECPPSVLLA